MTPVNHAFRVWTANQTGGSFSLPADTATKPDPLAGTNGYVGLVGGTAGAAWNHVACEFIGTNAANEVFTVQCYGVAEYDYASPYSPTWHHLPLWEVDVTLGTLVTTVAADEFYADAIAISQDESGATVRSYGSSEDFENAAARIEFDTIGCEMLFFQINVSTAATGNVVVRGF